MNDDPSSAGHAFADGVSGGRPRGGVEILLRFEALRLRAVLRIFRHFPMSATIGALMTIGVLAGARIRLAQVPEIAAHPGFIGAVIGVAAGWATTTRTMERWLLAVSEGPLAHVAAGAQTAGEVAVIRVLVICLFVFGLTAFLCLSEEGVFRMSGGYLAGLLVGAGLAIGLRCLRFTVRPRAPSSPVTRERAGRSIPAHAMTIIVHLRRPARSWGAGLSALAFALTGIAAGQVGVRDGVQVGQFAWCAAQIACGLIILSPHASLLRILATRPISLAQLYSELMLGRVALQFCAALFSAAFVFEGPLEILTWTLVVTVVPMTISTIQLFYGLMYEKTVADIRLCLDLGMLAFMAVLIGPIVLAAIPPWLWYLYVKTSRMRWGRM